MPDSLAQIINEIASSIPKKDRVAEGGSAPLSDYDFIKRLTQFTTYLPPEQIPAFRKWLTDMSKSQNRDVRRDLQDYDLAGFFKAGEKTDPVTQHGTDIYKKPWHVTFSNQSRYSDKENPGGMWTQSGGFIPGKANLRYYDSPFWKWLFEQGKKRGEKEFLINATIPGQ